jgi:dihydroorotate dehydrogenase (fumarate)
MIDLSTRYMGLQLKNPIIVGSSGLTMAVDSITEIENKGAAAVVLKSLFEEQIRYEISHAFNGSGHDTPYAYAEANDYISTYSRDHSLNEYLDFIRDCKRAVKIPVIASINCVSTHEWTTFARRIEDAGADGLELNIFILPSDPHRSGEENQNLYFEIVQNVIRQISIPLSIKISYYFSGLAKFALRISWTGIAGMVLFNRFYSPDIDVDEFKVVPSNIFSTPEEIAMSLRWVAILSDRVHCDIAASTGIHDGKAVIKQLLAGAKAVQCVTTFYKNGLGRIGEMLNDIEAWMQKHRFEHLSDFIGLMSFKKAENPAPYERVQFMKHFAGIE